MPRRLHILGAILSCFLAVATAPAQDDVAAGAPQTSDASGAETFNVEAELIEARRRLESLPEGADATRADLERVVVLLERLKRTADQRVATSVALEELRETAAQLDDRLETARETGPEASPPYSLLAVDALRDEAEAERTREEAVGAALDAATAALIDARQTLEEKETARRRALEAEETAGDADASRLARESRIAEIERELALETVALREAELGRAEAAKRTLDLRIDVIEAQLEWMRGRIQFTREDLQSRLSELEARREQLERRIATLENNVEFAEQDWFAARRRLANEPDDAPALREQVEARKLAYEATKEELEATRRSLQRLDDAATAWDHRFSVARGGATREALQSWEEEARTRIADLRTERRLQSARLEDIRGRVTGLAAQIDALEGSDDPRLRWLRIQRERLRDQAVALETRLASAATAIRLQERLLSDIGVETEVVTLAERLADLRERAAAVWSFELTSFDDRPITIGKIVIGLLIFLVGLIASRVLSRMLGRRILPRFRLHRGATYAIQSIVFYVLVITFTLFAFRAVNIPLTAFTVLGGALAIGVGFGSQNIINNFISGLILLVERPVRVGDLIEVDQLYATVEHIGARSTRVRTGSNVEVIIPNSTFLEQNVVNWTLSEDRYRTHVSVGVAYGSPTRDVTKLLRRTVDEHGLVLRNPEPIVLFTEFGDNALAFEVHFWIRMRTMMQRKQVESDIRHKIDSLFREAGVVVAFPQRDIHIDAAAPLPVRVLPPAEEANESGD